MRLDFVSPRCPSWCCKVSMQRGRVPKAGFPDSPDISPPPLFEEPHEQVAPAGFADRRLRPGCLQQVGTAGSSGSRSCCRPGSCFGSFSCCSGRFGSFGCRTGCFGSRFEVIRDASKKPPLGAVFLCLTTNCCQIWRQLAQQRLKLNQAPTTSKLAGGLRTHFNSSTSTLAMRLPFSEVSGSP